MKTVKHLIVAICMIFLLSNEIFAQEKDQTEESKLRNLLFKRFFLATGEVGCAIPTEGSKDKTVNIYSLSIGYNATPNISLVGSIERTSSFELGAPEEDIFSGEEVPGNLEDEIKSLGSIKISGFLGSLRYRLIKKMISLWIYGGVGQYSYEYDISEVDQIWGSFSEMFLNELVSELNRELDDIYVSLLTTSIWTDSEIDKSIGYHIGVNLDIPITEYISFFGNGKYFWLETKSKVSFNLGGKVKSSYLWVEETIPLDTIRFSIDEDLKLDSAVITAGLKIVF